MVYVASRHGYRGASVARVIERAGVSRATFYEHFSDREDCFLGAYRTIAGEMRAGVRSAAEASPPADRPRAVLEVLLGGVAADPAAGRLVLIEALGGTTTIRAEHERLISGLEEAIERFLGHKSARAPSLQIPPAALLSGVAGILSMRVLRGEAATLPSLLEELLAWIASYALAPGEPRLSQEGWEAIGNSLSYSARRHDRTAGAALLPRGRSAVSAGLAAAARRDRIITATARMAAAKGYSGMRVADIVAAARVTRSAFYSHFHSKEDAFLAAQTVALQESIAAAAADFFVASSWSERVWGGLAAMLDYIAQHPDLAYLGVVETHAAGPAAIQREHDSRMAYSLFLEDGYRQRPQARRLPRICSEAIAGAQLGLMRRQVILGRTAQMPEILPQCAYVALAPFIGPARAMELIETKAPAAAGGR